MSTGSLFERLGGVYAVSAAVDILVERLFENAAVKANPAVHEHHDDPMNKPGYKFLVTGWSIEAAGGPKCYVGQDMYNAHTHLAIDQAGFDAVYTEIDATLNFLAVPDAERTEFMQIIESYRGQVVQAPATAEA